MKRPLRRWRKINNRPYCIVNISLAGILMMVFIYSGLFSAKKENHPVPSFYEKFTGEKAPSSGLSRAFSEIMRGNTQEAGKHNKDSLLIFTFFLIQLVQRIMVTVLLYKQIPRTQILLSADLATSLLLFLYCFKGQLCAMADLVFA